MKKFLILVLIILALFTIDHPLIKEPRERLLGEGVSLISDASKVNRSPAANMAKNNIKSQLNLSNSELEYIDRFDREPYLLNPLFGLHRLQLQNINK